MSSDRLAMVTTDLPFFLLNETERLCLWLVYEGLTSKQIAGQRDMRADAVDRILRAARAKLGGLPRHEAARRLVEYETARNRAAQQNLGTPEAAEPPRQTLGAQGLALAVDKDIASLPQTERSNDGRQESSARGAASLLDGARYTGLRSWLFGSEGSLRNDLDIWSRIAAISVIAASAACLVGAALSFFIVLGRIVTGL